MCPVPREVMEKASKQVEDLFDQFLKISSHYEDFLPKRHSIEVDALQYDNTFSAGCLQRDTGKKPTGDNKPLDNSPVTRGPGVDLYNNLIKAPNINSRPSAPPNTNVLEDTTQENPSGRDDHPGVIVAAGISPLRSRSLSQGPTEQQIHDAALKIAEAGDEMEKKYAERMDRIGSQLLNFINTASEDLSYADLACHVNKLVADGDKDWTTLVVLFHVGKRVLQQTRNIKTHVCTYFRRYVASTFAEEVALQNGVVPFITSDRPTTAI